MDAILSPPLLIESVVGDDGVAAGAVLATRNVPAERRRAAALDRRHHLQLAEAHMASIGFTPSGPVVAEDVRTVSYTHLTLPTILLV